jgi:hypothetical protein
MNRINSIRNLALATALAALSLFAGAGCAAHATDDRPTGDEPDLAVPFVGVGSSNEESTAAVEQALETRPSLIHPNAGNNLGPRPEPWNPAGDANGPRPEPWATDESSGAVISTGGVPTPPPSGSSTSSSGGNPGNPNPTSK